MTTRPKREHSEARTFTRRALVLGGAQLGVLGLLVSRLYQIQVKDETRYGLLSDTNRTATQILTPPHRGRILDRFGEVLAGGREAYRATFTPALAQQPRAVIELVARIVPAIASDVDKLVTRARRQRPNEPMLLAGDLTFEQIAAISLLAPQLPGVTTELAEQRFYPRGARTGHIVGHIGHVEQVAIDDDPMLRLPWIRGGLSGIERGEDKRLSGSSGRVRLEVDARGRIVRDVERSEPLGGLDVVTTIDVVLQEQVLARLAGERCAAAVVMDAASGEVVAMASVPGFDPSPIVDGMSLKDWRRMIDAKDDPMLDRATAGQYPPGSTFKLVTALAALDAGTTFPRHKIGCGGAVAFGGQIYRCWNRGGHGRLDLVGAIRESCDVHFYELARQTGIERIAAMARRLGIGETFDCGLPLAKAGVVPDADWKMGALGRRWMGGETLHAAIGQGYVLATPLQLAVMTARIATGRKIAPRLVRPEQGAADKLAESLGIDERWLEAVRRGMREVINAQGGTGGNARIDDGVELAGKTGTAQVSRQSSRRAHDDLAWELRDHALFVAYAPADRPRYVVSLIVEHGGGGGAVAAPLARDIMTDALARDPMAKDALSMAPAQALAPAPATDARRAADPAKAAQYATPPSTTDGKRGG